MLCYKDLLYVMQTIHKKLIKTFDQNLFPNWSFLISFFVFQIFQSQKFWIANHSMGININIFNFLEQFPISSPELMTNVTNQEHRSTQVIFKNELAFGLPSPLMATMRSRIEQ